MIFGKLCDITRYITQKTVISHIRTRGQKMWYTITKPFISCDISCDISRLYNMLYSMWYINISRYIPLWYGVCIVLCCIYHDIYDVIYQDGKYHDIYQYIIYQSLMLSTMLPHSKVSSQLSVLTFRFPCQAEQQYLLWSHLHLCHQNHLCQVPAALSGIQTMNATGMTTTTFRQLAVT